jgi:hypothetical protein
VSTPPRRAAVLVERTGWAEEDLTAAGRRPGRATAAARVVFLELVVRLGEDFLDDFPAAAFFPDVDLFLVTCFPISFRLDEDLPDCLAFLLTVLPLAEKLLEDDFLEAAFFFGIR